MNHSSNDLKRIYIFYFKVLIIMDVNVEIGVEGFVTEVSYVEVSDELLIEI
jgi:hypothetical protein